MRRGVMYPGNEGNFDADDLDEWIDAVVAAGFDHVVFGDHVLGVDPSVMRDGWADDFPGKTLGLEPYTYRDTFREPMVLFGYLAAKCDLELVAGVVVLPQRQTPLLAKQAAEVDLLSRGRLRLAVGAGWNRAEFESMGADFATRGRRMEEQMELLRLLWTHEVVTFDGRFHTVAASGIGSLPVQRPIPLWIGASSTRGLERVGRLADGCFLASTVQPDKTYHEVVCIVRKAAESAGRDPDAVGMEGRVAVGPDPEEMVEMSAVARAWERIGASHLWIETRYRGLNTIGEHAAVIRRAGDVLRNT